VRWKDPANRRLVEEALESAGRRDLVARFHAALNGGARRPTRAARPEGEEIEDLDSCG